MIYVVVFVGFKYLSYAQFRSVEEARAYAHGLRRGYTLAGRGAGALYAAVLPEDQEQMAAIIPEGELALAQEAIKP